MKRENLLIFLIVIFTFEVIAQKIPSAGSETGSIQLHKEAYDEHSAIFNYKLEDKNYALFISEKADVEKIVVIKEIKPIGKDTVMFTALKKFGNIGKLIASTFETNSGRLCINDLPSEKDYYLHLYKRKTDKPDTFELLHTLEFNTLAQSPGRSSRNLTFDEVTDTSFFVKWLNGDGEGRIVVVAPEGAVSTPEDGRAYQASSVYGKDFARQGNGFVVYDGNERRPKVKITGLKPATKYTVAVYEYNGSGKYRNYNTEPASNNPRTIATKLQAPKITKVVRTEEGAYLIRWSKVVGAYTYILDLAEDKNFEKRIEPYIDIDVGDLGEFELSDLPKKKYYLRIKAKGEVGESNYSPTFEIK